MFLHNFTKHEPENEINLSGKDWNFCNNLKAQYPRLTPSHDIGIVEGPVPQFVYVRNSW